MQTAPTMELKSKTFEVWSTSLEAAIEALVEIAHESASLSDFYRDALPIVAICLHCTYLEVELRTGGTIVHERYSRDSVDPGFWSEITQEALVDALAIPQTDMRVFVGREVDISVALITAPVGIQGRRGGAIAAILPFKSRAELAGIRDELDVLCTLVSSLTEALGDARQASAAETLDHVDHLRKVASFTSEVELAYAITNKLRTRDGCVQVAMASMASSQLNLLSVSGLDEISTRAPGIKNLRMAMLECADLGIPVVDQVDGLEAKGVSSRGRLHRQWREAVGDASVASLPLFSGENLVAILSMQRVQKAPFTAEDLEIIRESVEPYAAGLEMVRVARRSLSQHVRDSSWSFAKTFFTRGAWGRKLALTAALLLGTWSILGSVSYSVSAPCALSPMAGRQVAAATGGVLDAVFVKPGDRVEAGQLLCEFDSRELQLEAARLRGEVATHDVELYRALGEGATAEAELARTSGRAVQANLDYVLHRISNARVASPVDGVILEGDHRTRVGAVFSKGEPLFRIAEGSSWKLEVYVPERDFALMRVGAEGAFATHSRPGSQHAMQVIGLSPMAQLHEGKNVFAVEALCEIQESWVRSGMEGFASIDAGDRPPAWVAGHRLLDFMRMHLWL